MSGILNAGIYHLLKLRNADSYVRYIVEYRYSTEYIFII